MPKLFLPVTFLVVLMIFITLIGMNRFYSDNHFGSGSVYAQSESWTKPQNLVVVALVFYGRRVNVQILERYLRVCHLGFCSIID